jgi:uncharacterized membrane protein YraQ (UPF0718 family)
MAVAAVFLGVMAFVQGGWEALNKGLFLGGKMLIQVIPLLVLAFSTAGLVSVLTSKETVTRWMGRKAGLKGLFLGGLAGALVPGGPYAYFPVAATFLVSGAEIGTVISFVLAKNLWTLSRLPLELALLGPKITIIRYIVTFSFPILAGLAANALFAGFTEKIRIGIRELQRSNKV